MYFAVNGGYGQWGKWSECSVTCGSKKGTRRRDRLCDSPKPANGGKDCSRLGKDTETEECKPKVSKCPGKYTHLISRVLNKRLRKYIVCKIRDTNVVLHSGGKQILSRLNFVSLKFTLKKTKKSLDFSVRPFCCAVFLPCCLK